MRNRFLETKSYLDGLSGQTSHSSSGSAPGYGRSFAHATHAGSRRIGFSTPFTAAQRALVVLIENGGVDLGIGSLVDTILDELPGSSLIPQAARDALVKEIDSRVRQATDSLLESAELILNRYEQAKPDHYGEVVVLRNDTAFYQSLRDTLIRLTRENKVIDLFVLTHGADSYIALSGGTPITAHTIREIRSVHNADKPVRLRTVYMMNCVGASLNQAWLDIGARASAGSIRNNYMPEPTMYFFFDNWKSGQSFSDSVINAYRSSIEAINSIIRGAADVVMPGPGIAGRIAERLADIENRAFVQDSAPVIAGDGSVSIQSDDLSSGSAPLSLPFTVVPLAAGALARTSRRRLGRSMEVVERTRSHQASDALVEFVKSFEGFRPNLYDDPAGHCTIGYGTLVHRGPCNGADSEAPYASGISEARATELLRERLTAFEGVVNDTVRTAMSQHQFDALVSFCYNVGSGAFRSSTLLRKLNEGDYDSVPTEMARWVKANGRELPGLVRRRAAEGRMFASGDYSTGSEGRSLGLAEPFQQRPQPRGLRNNNPGNIRLTNQAWEGKVPNAQNTDGTFEQFTRFDFGVRALILLLRNYMTRGQQLRNTVRRIISSFAPPTDDNHTERYISFVVERLRRGGLDIDAETVLQANRQTLRLLSQAIGRMENGVECISDQQFEAGLRLLPQDVRAAIGQSLQSRPDTSEAIDEIARAALEPEIGELEDEGFVGGLSTDISPHCPINPADDAQTEHFRLSEFDSKDGAATPRGVRGNIQLLMEQLEVLRAECGGRPVTILSGYRSPAHNEAVRGAPRSQHLCGRAADIRVKDLSPEEVHAKIEELIAAGRMIEGGLGRYASFVHYDTRGHRARW